MTDAEMVALGKAATDLLRIAKDAPSFLSAGERERIADAERVLKPLADAYRAWKRAKQAKLPSGWLAKTGRAA